VAILNLQQLLQQFTKFKAETEKSFKAHQDKINSLEMDTIAALRVQIQALAKRVHDLEKLQKAKAP
jgi:hypothetical protein